MDPYIGQINLFGFNWAPLGWMLADSTVMSIDQFAALYSLLGNQFGGDGIRTFALPDLRGRFPIGQGAGPSLTPRTFAQQYGTETTTLTSAQMPCHNHASIMGAAQVDGNSNSPSNGAYMANAIVSDRAATPVNIYYTGSQPGMVTMNTGMTGMTGDGLPVHLMNPSLALNFSIAVTGVYPTRP